MLPQRQKRLVFFPWPLRGGVNQYFAHRSKYSKKPLKTEFVCPDNNFYPALVDMGDMDTYIKLIEDIFVCDGIGADRYLGTLGIFIRAQLVEVLIFIYYLSIGK